MKILFLRPLTRHDSIGGSNEPIRLTFLNQQFIHPHPSMTPKYPLYSIVQQSLAPDTDPTQPNPTPPENGLEIEQAKDEEEKGK